MAIIASLCTSNRVLAWVRHLQSYHFPFKIFPINFKIMMSTITNRLTLVISHIRNTIRVRVTFVNHARPSYHRNVLGIGHSRLSHSNFKFRRSFLISTDRAIPTCYRVSVTRGSTIKELYSLTFTLREGNRIFNLNNLIRILVSFRISPYSRIRFQAFKVIRLGNFFTSSGNVIRVTHVGRLQIIVMSGRLNFQGGTRDHSVVAFIIRSL